jgi:hypothetical protein
MRSRPTIRLYSDDAKRQRRYRKLGLVVWLGLPVSFGAAVYASTEWGAIGSWTLALVIFILPAALIALSLGRIVWLR